MQKDTLKPEIDFGSQLNEKKNEPNLRISTVKFKIQIYV